MISGVVSGRRPARLAYPESLRDKVASMGVEFFDEGVEVSGLSEALSLAKSRANSRDMPIEVTFCGTSRVVYPDSLSKRGY